MQVARIPTLDDETNQIRLMTADIVATHIIPNEKALQFRDNPDAQELWKKLQDMVKE